MKKYFLQKLMITKVKKSGDKTKENETNNQTIEKKIETKEKIFLKYSS